MAEMVRYAVFKTGWGWFGLTGTEEGLLRTQMPGLDKKHVKCRLLQGLGEIKEDRGFRQDLQSRIKSYFKGSYVEFGSDIRLDLRGFSKFSGKVLVACMNVTYGETISYGQLAKRAGSSKAARAAAQVMAANRLPLIIPRHRVILSTGQAGGYSAEGGAQTKKKMLELERLTVQKRG